MISEKIDDIKLIHASTQIETLVVINGENEAICDQDLTWQNLLNQFNKRIINKCQINLDDPAVLQYFGGTTGTKQQGIDEEGELILCTPQVMAGYHNRPGETKLTLRKGWLFTGDVVRMDRDGYFYLVDRKKDVINVGGVPSMAE